MFTLMMISTYMGGTSGLCFLKQETIAKNTGAVVRTVRRHIARAVELGFLVVSEESAKKFGQAWRRTYYQAHIPASIPLSEDERDLANTVGSIDPLTSQRNVEPPVTEQPFKRRRALVEGASSGHPSQELRTPGAPRCGHSEHEGADIRGADTASIEGADTIALAAHEKADELNGLRALKGADIASIEGADNPPPKSYLREVVKEVVKSEAHSRAPRATGIPISDAHELRRKRIEKALKECPQFTDEPDTIAKMSGTTIEEVLRVRTGT